MYASGEPDGASDPPATLLPGLDRLLADDETGQPETGRVEAATDILFAATADRLVRDGTFTPQQVRELITALRRSDMPGNH